ncbi:MAG TPA: alpha/beta hydrolase [Candidatus Acidoferrales bacterium]|nr:alpha/beta hydrolase [Candidatus Acidoferrales bacterium]
MAHFCRMLLTVLLFVGPAFRTQAWADSEHGVSPGPGSYVQVEGGKLYYEECGSAFPQTVVLIHDGVVDSKVWDDVWPAFCKRFHTIRYDRRGYGRSPAATTWYWETDDLGTLLHHLKIKRTVLVGSSHGGSLAINFTLAHPEIVQQLVLVGAVVSGMPYSQHFLDRSKPILALLKKGDLKGAIAEWSKDKYLIGPGHDAARKRLFDLLSANPQDLTHADYPLESKPALPRLHEIHVPTLVLIGAADDPDVHVHAGAIEAGIPNSRLVVVPGVGHLMYLEESAEFARLVIHFVELNRAGGS